MITVFSQLAPLMVIGRALVFFLTAVLPGNLHGVRGLLGDCAYDVVITTYYSSDVSECC